MLQVEVLQNCQEKKEAAKARSVAINIAFHCYLSMPRGGTDLERGYGDVRP